MKTSYTHWAGWAACLAVGTTVLAAADPSPAQVDFFEKKIRPVLTDKCYNCHSEKSEKLKAGLLVDSREGLLKGGDNGPCVVPGDPNKSLLIKAIRYTDDNLQMPPKGDKLSAQIVKDFEEWVKMGAPDPRVSAGVDKYKEAAKEAERSHWAFKPVVKPAIPDVKLKGWVQSPVDAFIIQKLEEKAMMPSLTADKRTLIRRATFDLIGLPPTPQEVKDFVDDNSPDAFNKVVDRLLASPHYGERWGRYWLDIARYSDTKGEVNRDREDPRYPYAWTYRDYVIRSFNEDKPYDQFLMEQIAADRLPGAKPETQAALGFITLGKRFMGNQNDIIDDRIDVVTKGTMALTVTCARCHDHKFDPIPTKDYYSLYGIFQSSIEPEEEPLLNPPKDTPEFRDFNQQLASLSQEVKAFHEARENEILEKLRSKVGDYLYATAVSPKLPNDQRVILVRQTLKLDQGVLNAWQNTMRNIANGIAKKQHNPIFIPWFEFAKLSDAEFATRGKDIAAKTASNTIASKPINPLVARAFVGNPPANMREVADRYAKLLLDADAKWKSDLAAYEHRKKIATSPPIEPTALIDKYWEEVRQVLYSPTSPANPPSAQIDRLFPMQDQRKESDLRAKIVTLELTHPGSPPRSTALMDAKNPRDSKVFIRGNASSLGEVAPRQFLTMFAGDRPESFTNGSGRLQLARAIASKDNPLTARVMVNRVWMYHFGEGLVSTTSDFGSRAVPPTHPELLDFLAASFMESGWSVKKLHRMIMLSSAYQQSSEHNPRYAQVDPGNKLLWRMNIKRLDFEALRDSLLAIGGKLQDTAGGQPVDITKEDAVPRRTVYAFIDRGQLPEVFNTFDFANPDITTSKRYSTTVPQQALYLMNSPLVVAQARNLTQRPDFTAIDDEQKRIELLYNLIYQRPPGAEEVKLGLQFLETLPTVADVAPERTWSYGFGEVDEGSRRTRTFQPLTVAANGVWQTIAKLPHKVYGYLSLNAKGGHPGKGLKEAAIRRWTAPRDGVIAINGTLGHADKNGDGVRGRIIFSRTGELGNYIAQNKQVGTSVGRLEVKKGDTIDFVVDCRTNDGADTFTWAPVITMTQETSEVIDGITKEWKAETDFAGSMKAARKPLGAWEKYAHVLLLSNEACFIN